MERGRGAGAMSGWIEQRHSGGDRNPARCWCYPSSWMTKEACPVISSHVGWIDSLNEPWRSSRSRWMMARTEAFSGM